MAGFADIARDHANASSSPYVGVILLRMPPQVADQTPTWYAYDFPSRAALDEWYADAVGTPSMYFYLGAFDKTPAPWRTPGHAVAEAPHQAPRVGATIAGVAMSKFDQLAQIVALHETYFAALAQKYPRSEQVRTWLTGSWDPFFRRWLDITADGDPLGDSLVREVSRSLSQLRDVARARGIPVPDLGTATPARAPTPTPTPAVDPMVAQLNAETDRRFAEQYGVTHKLNPRDPHDAALIPVWLDIRYQVAQEAARLAEINTQVAGGGHHPGGGGHHPGGGHHRGRGRGGWGGGYGWDPYWYGYGYPYGYGEDVDVNVYVNPPADDPAWNDYGAVISGDRGSRFDRVPHHERLVAIAPSLVPEMMGGWFDSITGAVHAAINGVGHAASSVVGTVGHTLYRLKGPIAAAAGIAAGAAAMAVPGAGPLLAPMAAGLANNLVNAAAGDGDVAQAAQAVVSQATELAQKSPEVAKALGTAHEAVAKAATGYHIVQTVANAAAGNKDALDQINELSLEAAAGNPAAQSAIQLAHGAISASEQQQHGVTLAVSAGWFLPFALGVPTGVAAAYFGPPAFHWTKKKWDERKMQKLADQEIARLHAMTPQAA